jgi:TetR/AcrR family transcriptional regulator, regulator of autoinduction and epiphytic fitness
MQGISATGLRRSGALALIKAKRIRRDPDTTRRLILDTTEQLMVEEGYAAVTSRRIAQELALNPATVHYYYRTMDDIFIALHRRLMGRQIAELEAVLAADNPVEALWAFQSGWGHSALGVELIALASHRKSIRNMLAAFAEEARDVQAEALGSVIGRLGFDPAILPPVALATILVAIARTLANEERVGITRGHKEVRAFVQWALNTLAQPHLVARKTHIKPAAAP